MQQNLRTSLPIDPYLEEIAKIWQEHSTVILKASPGSGKTTRLPWKLAQHSPKKVVVLEPRRLAAKLAAHRIAEEADLIIGQEVGYHFRFEKKFSAESKLIFYTEGTFLRLLLNEGNVDEVGTIILDEFHERHIETDVALACIRALQKKRPDLKLVLMSATLDSKLRDEFPDSGLIEVEARQFKVEIEYLENQPSILNRPLEVQIKKILERLKPDDGDVLVFVPGMREMRRIENYLGQQFGQVHLLHAELSKEEQDKTLRVQPGRKIILATNVAESSITIPGIRIVIDSGIQREAKYSPWTGLKTLEDRPTTQSSSIQRAGRAGRTSDGKCFRLYSEQDFKSREAYTVPEILKADLTDTYLLTRRMHLNLEWFTPPPPERWRKAQDLSFKLGAIDEKNELTSVGEKMLKFPLGARLSRILLFAEKYKREEKKKLLGFICDELEKDSYGILKQRLGFFLNESGTENGSWEKALLSGFIDQVAKFRIKQHDFIHYSGKTLKAHKDLKNLQEGYYLILDITPRMEAYLVVPIEEEWLYEMEPFPFTEEESVTVDDVISIRLKTMMGSILIDETHFKKNWSEVSQSVAGKILTQGESTFRKKWSHWSDSTDFLRLHFLAKVKKISWDEVESSINLKDYFQSWNALNWDGLTDYFLQKVLQALQITSIEQELPLKINLGGKRDIAVQYPFGLDPFIEAPIQDFYGVVKTPMILNNTLPLTMKLLGPHKMPIQVTKDIASFWSKTYPEMKKEWQRDYPRHHWPDDPRTAKPILLKRQLESS